MTVGPEGLRFNYELQVETVFITGRPVIHIVDVSNHFCAAGFLRSQSTKELWRMLQNLWILVYLGPPDFIAVDQGTSYISKEMRANAEAAGIKIREAPIEKPGSIGVVERYHAPLRKAFDRIRLELDRKNSNDDCLRLAVFSVNTTVGPEGLCPALVVFGAIPRPAGIFPAPTKAKIAYALKHTGQPKGVEASNELRRLPAGAKVLLYRTSSDKWEGPLTFVNLDGETATVQTPRGRRIFRSSCIRPWTGSTLNPTEATRSARETTLDENADKTKDAYAAQPSYCKKNKKENSKKDAGEFRMERQKELLGLLEGGTFEPVSEREVPDGIRIFGSRFIDELKRGEKERVRKKSRLVAQNYNDLGSCDISTKAPTVQRMTQRIDMSLAASIPGMRAYTRDITQAYIQSATKLERQILIRAPAELGLPLGAILRVVKPLYGIPESGLHWYITYLSHHVESLGMQKATLDPCPLFKRTNGTVDGIIIIEVDDTFGCGTDAFLENEQTPWKTFKSKPRNFISTATTIFNGVTIAKSSNGTITLSQEDKIHKVNFATTDMQLVSERAATQYIGVNTRPDVCASTQLIAPGREDTTPQEFKVMKRIIQSLKDYEKVGVRFVSLDLSSPRLLLLTDACFANVKDSKSEVGFLIMMADKDDKVNIIHYGSSRCRRITRSVMAAGLHALILGFDLAYVIRQTISEILHEHVPIEVYVDSKTVFDVIAKDAKTTERRLQIDIAAIKESYARGELDRIAWIPGTINAADALKILGHNNEQLRRMMDSNELRMKPIWWATMTREKKITRVSMDIDHNAIRASSQDDGQTDDEGSKEGGSGGRCRRESGKSDDENDVE